MLLAWTLADSVVHFRVSFIKIELANLGSEIMKKLDRDHEEAG